MGIRQKKVLVACGCGIATSSALADKVARLCKANNIPVSVEQCIAAEVPMKVSQWLPDLVLVSTETPRPKDSSIPYFKGMAYLTGIGEDKLNQQIPAVLKA